MALISYVRCTVFPQQRWDGRTESESGSRPLKPGVGQTSAALHALPVARNSAFPVSIFLAHSPSLFTNHIQIMCDMNSKFDFHL